MEEQVKRLKELGFSALQIKCGTKDHTTEKRLVETGAYAFVFSSPEYLLGEEVWRDVMQSSVYRDKRVLLVIDEAHTVIEWYVC